MTNEQKISTAKQLVEVFSAASALALRLRSIQDDPQFVSVWQVAQLHVGPYVGPTYTNELSDLETALGFIASAERGPEYNGGDTPPV